MNWYKTAQKLRGYKIVGYDDNRYYSLYDQSPINTQIGSIASMGGHGLYLGTSVEFCKDYYSGLTDDNEALLTYEFLPQDIIKGNPTGEGEIQVRSATLVAVQNLSQSVSPDMGKPS